MDYKVKIRGKPVTVPYDKFIAWNNDLSKRYHEEKDLARRREIAAFLFDLDKPLFQSWDIFDPDDRQDYEQEAFLHFITALQRHDPSRGAFVDTLKRFYQRTAKSAAFDTARKQQEIRKAAGDEVDPPAAPKDQEGDQEARIAAIQEFATNQDYGQENDADTPVLDPLTEKRLRKSLTPEQYRVFDLRINQGLPRDQVADIAGLSEAVVRKRLQEAIGAANIAINKVTTRVPELPDGSRWITKDAFCHLFGISRAYLKTILNPSASPQRSAHYIDPRDTTALQGTRIRYLEREDGLHFPRLIRRTPKSPPNP